MKEFQNFQSVWASWLISWCLQRNWNHFLRSRNCIWTYFRVCVCYCAQREDYDYCMHGLPCICWIRAYVIFWEGCSIAATLEGSKDELLTTIVCCREKNCIIRSSYSFTEFICLHYLTHWYRKLSHFTYIIEDGATGLRQCWLCMQHYWFV